MPCSNSNKWNTNALGLNVVTYPEFGDVIIKANGSDKDEFNKLANAAWDKYDIIIDPVLKIRDQFWAFRWDKAYLDRFDDIIARMDEDAEKGISIRSDPVVMNALKLEYKPKFNSLYVGCNGGNIYGALDIVFGGQYSSNYPNENVDFMNNGNTYCNTSLSSGRIFLYLYGFGLVSSNCLCSSGCSSCGGSAYDVYIYGNPSSLNLAACEDTSSTTTSNGTVGSLVSSTPIEVEAYTSASLSFNAGFVSYGIQGYVTFYGYNGCLSVPAFYATGSFSFSGTYTLMWTWDMT